MNCLVCGQSTKTEIGYHRCPQCGLVKVASSLHYSLDEYTKTYRSWYDSDLEIRINVNRVATVMKFVPLGARVLDFGCSCGNFLSRLEKYNYACEGYEPSKTASANKTCRAIIHDDIDQIKGKFNCITLFDVFEHFDNPIHMMTVLRSMLSPGGTMVIISPNAEFRPDLENFYHLKPGEHAYLWSKKALTTFMESHGLCLIHSEFSEGWMRRNALGTEPFSPQTLLTTVFVAT